MCQEYELFAGVVDQKCLQKQHHKVYKLVLNAYFTLRCFSVHFKKGDYGSHFVSFQRPGLGRMEILLSQSEQQLLKRVKGNKTPELPI